MMGFGFPLAGTAHAKAATRYRCQECGEQVGARDVVLFPPSGSLAHWLDASTICGPVTATEEEK